MPCGHSVPVTHLLGVADLGSVNRALPSMPEQAGLQVATAASAWVVMMASSGAGSALAGQNAAGTQDAPPSICVSERRDAAKQLSGA